MMLLRSTLCTAWICISAGITLAQGNFYNRGSVTIASGSELQVKGEVVLDKPVTGSGFLSLTGNSLQGISGMQPEIDNLRLQDTGDAILHASLMLHQSADFVSGKLRLEGYNLLLDDTGIFTGGTTGSFVETSGTGKIITGITSSPEFFPLGFGQDFFPITITENGLADTFSIRAFGYLPADGLYQGVPLTSDVGLLAWQLTDNVPGGNDLLLELQWPDAANASSFNQRFAIPLWHNSTNYIALDSCATDVRFMDPNLLASVHSLSSGTFGVGDDAYLPYTPVTDILPASDTAFCLGDSAVYTAGTGSAYLWSNGDTTHSVSLTQSGIYAVAITQTNGCIYTSDSVSVTVWPLPAPVVNRIDSTLSTGTFTAYQWYLNGNAISGATGQSYTVTQNGSYTVEVTNTFGCSSVSAPLVINDLGINGSGEFTWQIGPNPFHGSAWINLSQLPAGEVTVQLTDMTGRLLQTQLLQTTTVAISCETPGMYLLTLYQGSKKLLSEKLVVY